MRGIPYSTTRFPPCPVVRVRFSYLFGPGREVLATIDTGADRTMVPLELLREIVAWETRRSVSCIGYDGIERRWPIYQVDLHIVEPRWPDNARRDFPDIEIVGVVTPESDGISDVLLGRDILAAWSLQLDGPNSRYSVS